MRSLFIYTGLLLTVCILNSCRTRGVLSRDDMTEILYEIHLTESLSESLYGPVAEEWRKGLEPDYFRDLSFQSVLRKHHVTEAQFYKSVGYYSRNLRIYSRIYANIEKRLRVYSQAIDDWEYHQLSDNELNENYTRDSIIMLSLYEKLHIRPDTTSVLKNSYCPDSVESYVTWYSNLWLRENKPDTTTFIMVDPALALRRDSLSTDSLDIIGSDVDILAKDTANVMPKPVIILNEKGEVVATEGRRKPSILPNNQLQRTDIRKRPVPQN